MRSGTHVLALVLVGLGCGGCLLFLEMEGLNVLAWPSRQSSEMPEQTNQLKLELTRARIMNEQLKARVAELSSTPSPTLEPVPPSLAAWSEYTPPVEWKPAASAAEQAARDRVLYGGGLGDTVL